MAATNTVTASYTTPGDTIHVAVHFDLDGRWRRSASKAHTETAVRSGAPWRDGRDRGHPVEQAGKHASVLIP